MACLTARIALAAPSSPAKSGPVPAGNDAPSANSDSEPVKDGSAPVNHGSAPTNDGSAPVNHGSASGKDDARAKQSERELPDPRTTHQSPASIPEPPPRARYWSVEVGPDVGVIDRPSSGDGVHDEPGFVIGGHARIEPLKWLGARLTARVESAPYTIDEGAFQLPRGTRIDQPGPRRVYLSASAEPTWSPVPRLALWAGVGIAWGRTTAPALHASGQQVLVVPSRSAVFVEVPLSLGVRYEIVPYWLVVNLSVTAGLPSNQSGGMIEPYRTPGKDGALVTVGGFPELGVSVAGLAGLGVLL